MLLIVHAAIPDRDNANQYSTRLVCNIVRVRMARECYRTAALLVAAQCFAQAVATSLNAQWPLPSVSPNMTVYEGDLILLPELCLRLYGSQVCRNEEVRSVVV